ncbi:MAG: hypothetical protein P1T08_05045 [Acidimicrobiia bacterium]|nr:hypothetical protein [Acidimicrobiia bacterium]
MRYLLSALAITLVLAACGESRPLTVAADPDVFRLAAVDSYSSTTAYTYSFQAGETFGDVGSIANAVHTAEPRRTRVNGEITAAGVTTQGEIYFLEDGSVLSRTGMGPFVPIDETVDDVTWLGAIHAEVANSAGEFEYVGEETVAARVASHFEGPPIFPGPVVADQLAAGLGITVDFEGTTDVWVDADGLVLAFEMAATADDGIGFVTVTVSARINELGAVIAIVPPAEGLIIPGDVLADDRAKNHLNDVLIAAQLFHTGEDTFSGLTTETLDLREPSVSYVDGPLVTTPDVVGFIAEPDRVLLVTFSETGTWFCVAEDRSASTPIVTFGGGSSNDMADSFEDCSNPVWPPSTN